MESLKDKVVVVTGGTSGIGKGFVESFAAAGAKVVFCGRREDMGRQVAEATGATFVQADVLKEKDIERVFQTAKDTFGSSIDIFLANAGIEGAHATNIMSEDFWETYEKVMEVNLKSVIQTCRIGIPYLNETDGYCFIISSVNSSVPVPGFGPYCMSKAGCDALVRCLAAETPDHVNVYSLNPYLIQSEMTERLCSTFEVPDVEAWAKGVNPSGKVGTGPDLAELVANTVAGKYKEDFPSGSSLLTDGHVLFHARQAMDLAGIKGTPEFDERISKASIK